MAKTEEILNRLCQEIGGEWLLVGGTLVQLHYDGERATEDIDLVHMSHPTKSRETTQNELFQFTLKKWGLGPEVVNLSAEFFVNQMQGWQREIVPLKKGPSGTVFRPTLTLFCALKMQRASELDLRDIRAALRKSAGESLNFELLSKWLSAEKVHTLRSFAQL